MSYLCTPKQYYEPTTEVERPLAVPKSSAWCCICVYLEIINKWIAFTRLHTYTSELISSCCFFYFFLLQTVFFSLFSSWFQSFFLQYFLCANFSFEERKAEKKINPCKYEQTNYELNRKIGLLMFNNMSTSKALYLIMRFSYILFDLPNWI